MSNKTKIWIKAAAVRAIKTVAQTAVGVIGASALITEVDFLVVLSASALAGLVSLLTSVADLPEVDNAGTGNKHCLAWSYCRSAVFYRSASVFGFQAIFKTQRACI